MAKCKRCGSSKPTLCDKCISHRQSKLKSQIHSRNVLIRQMRDEIARLSSSEGKKGTTDAD